MQNEIISDEYSNDRPDLTQPHFDEEATLLSARPVVPLAAVEAKTHAKRNRAKSDNRRDFLLIGAAAAAVVLGILAGILFYSTDQVTPKVAAEATAAPTRDDEIAADGGIQESDEVEAPLNRTTEGVKVSKTKAVITVRPTRRDNAEVDDDDGDRPKAQLFGVIRQRRASSRRENNHETRGEQRPRRVGRRQGSGPKTSSDELFRIGEIFEGAPQP